MVVKTPQQLEDAAIADVIRSVVQIKTRNEQRELQNRITELVYPKIERARLRGQGVDIHKFVMEVVREIASA